MGFDRLPPNHRGSGARIAIISSGAAATHPDLSGRLADGRDTIAQDDKSWQEDPIGTGTHLAVLIGGRDDGTGVVGLAPEAELHACRTAPGGYTADLLEALDYCITRDIDIALIATGVPEHSGLLAAKVAQAREHGVAVIAAAGDGAGPVGYPAALPGVLSVGALGLLGTFPPGTGEATLLPGSPSPDGYFTPAFSNRAGDGLGAVSGWGAIDCCAPGVAIVSGMPPSSYGPLDGTAVAAAHVAGLAALVLAHHPRLQAAAIGRDPARVDLLLHQLLASCRPLPGLHPASAGRGIPDAAAAVGFAPHAWPALPSLRPPEDLARDTLAQLDAAMWSAGILP
jgi:subtilisin family serine protease